MSRTYAIYSIERSCLIALKVNNDGKIVKREDFFFAVVVRWEGCRAALVIFRTKSYTAHKLKTNKRVFEELRHVQYS